jgi:vacuolar-type H+-ATPase subunit H
VTVAESPMPPEALSPTVDALRRVKAAEGEWSQKVAEAKAHRDAAIARAREESEAAIRSAQAELERERAAALSLARTTADAEAARILADGDRAAEAVPAADPGASPARKAKVLGVVLGEFASD